MGYNQRLRTIADEDLLNIPVVYAAAGTPNAVFAVSPRDLVRITEAKVVNIKEGWEPFEVRVFSEDYSRSVSDDKPLSGIDRYHLFHSIPFPELRNADIMSPSDLEEVVAFFDHIDGPDRFPKILLKGILFPFGDFDPIATPGEIEPTDLRVELLNDLEIGLRCLSNSC